MKKVLRNSHLIVLLLEKASYYVLTPHHQSIPIPPETYAFLLEHDYRFVRSWVLTGTLAPEIKSRLPLLEENNDLIIAWVHHNERNAKMLPTKPNYNKPLIGLVEFYDQIQRT